ncbi:DNA primase large subunit Spp2 [Emydomyces testavorans]|uniref:Pre-mRNA-splicing factor n=1 Tax=Emydomyces testavorans TaxID=2070801 RepID=A0AAF0IM47_9EURO|nr:DNA primase large subunit Spp2 [Emydomyces testavorans]
MSPPRPFSIALSSRTPSASTAQQPPSSSTPSIPLPRRSNPPTSTPNTTPRPGFHDHDSDASDTELAAPAHEEVSGFDQSAGGAISRHARDPSRAAAAAPLVIQVEKRNGWRERLLGSARAKKSWLPEEVRAQRQGGREDVRAAVEVEGPSTKVGLSYVQAESRTEERDGHGEIAATATATAVATEAGEEVAMEVDTERRATEDTDVSQDERALRALIRESKGEVDENSDLIIQSRAGPGDPHAEYDETRSFRDDVARRPEPASLADYAAIPVEQFGAALLRGMGWKEGQPVGRGRYSSASAAGQQDTSLAPRIPERRPGYLGIGAKDLSGKAGAAELELGAWGKAAMRKGKPGEGLYTPVLMKNKKTGEMVTEEEFKKLTKEQEREKEKMQDEHEWKERRDRNLRKSGRRRDDDHKGSRGSSSGRNGHGRSRSSSADRDRDRRRRRRYDDDYYDDRDRDDYDSEPRRRGDRHYRDRDYRRDRGEEREREQGRDRGRDKYDAGKKKERGEDVRDRDRGRDRRDYR